MTKLKPYCSIIFLLAGIINYTFAQDQPQGPERWEETIQKFEQADQANPVTANPILFVGSSSIAIWQDIAEYFPEKNILNRGFGGSNFEDLLYYADRVIYPYKPAKVFVYEGDNDLAQGISPKKTFKRARKLRKKIARALGDTPVVFIAAKPSVARWEMKEDFLAYNSKLKAYAEKTDHTEYADVWTPAIGEDGKVVSHIFRDDNLHMNAEGYKIWHRVLAPYVNE